MYVVLHKMLHPFILTERCPKRLAQAASLGVYIAFSPFFGLHTVMHFLFGWLLGLNIPLLLFVGYAINNPWTMVPIYASGYMVGYWIMHTWWMVPLAESNPVWMHAFNQKLAYYVGMPHVSFWAFMIGANLLGIVLALILYPLFKKMFSYVLAMQFTKGTV